MERKIIFVCTGNTCRSPMAEAILKSEIKRLRLDDVSVYSAGIAVGHSGKINENSAYVLMERGLELDNFFPRQLIFEDIKESYAVVCMTDEIRDFLKEKCRQISEEGSADFVNKIYSFSEVAGYEISDPYGKDLSCYRETYSKIERGMSALIAAIFRETAKETEEKTLEKEEKKQTQKTKKATKSKPKQTKKTTSRTRKTTSKTVKNTKLKSDL